tara:strand:+ start:56181 stop:56801 length:621 start_codon:yes stop_codon:yes gene_type:complete
MMRMAGVIRVLCALLLLGTAAAAQSDYPRLHDVVGVASNDVLNVRGGPGASFPVVGELAYDARAVEVIRAEGNWGMVNVPEAVGWAALRFLAPRAEGDISTVQRLTCGGTEPFWKIDILPGQSATVKTPVNYEVGDTFSVGLMRRAYNPLEKWVLLGADGARNLSVVVAKTYCNNGMSDNEFGFDATVIVAGTDGYVLSGCCELSE